MGTAFQCDRCGQLFGVQPSSHITLSGRNNMGLTTRSENKQSLINLEVDLCEKCTQDFNHFWRSIVRPVKPKIV
jgi:NMD protein affecting ribosome stability and mRNA decay